MRNIADARTFVVLVLLVFQSSPCLAQSTAGIGAALGQKEDRVFISKLLPDGAASASGQLRVGDWIIGVQEPEEMEEDVSKSNIQSVVGLLRGEKGTVVRVTVVPEGKELSDAKTVVLTRGTIAALERYGDGKLPVTGDPIPDVNMIFLDDKSQEIKLRDLRGRYIYLEIWTSWCGSCQKNMARLQETVTTYESIKEKMVFIGASADDSAEQAKTHLEKKKWDKTVNVWLSEKATKELHVNSFPVVFLIDDKGTIIANNHEAKFEETVSKLLKQLSDD